MGLGEGLTDLCKMLILQPGEPDFSEILSLLYDLSSKIKVPSILIDYFGDSGDTLKDIIDFIGTDEPMNLAGKILLILPLAINELLSINLILFCS